MLIRGLIWVGSATDNHRETADFFGTTLGMETITDIDDFTRLVAANGDRMELFGPNSQEYAHLDTGPVAGFWVDDAAAARQELIDDGVADCTPLERGSDGHGWFYFRAPDGNYYELCERAHPEGH